MQRTTALLATIAALLLGAAAPALGAGSQLVIRGAGFGHGVGMSQYGAYGYALHGADYRAILGHYYTGTALQPVGPPRTVRVLLRSSSSARVSGASSTADGKALDPTQVYEVVPSGLTKVALRDASGTVVTTVDPPLTLSGADGAPLTLRGTAANGLTNGQYRGTLEFRPTSVGGLLSVNAVGLEDYVRGVVGVESFPSWPAAALQAQAVAARTYAITTAKSVTNGFDQFADTRSQVYKGVKAETPTTDAAVASTAGQVVAYRGVPAVTFFFSTSGGHTEDVENAFAGASPQPWLVGVDDPYDNTSPVHRWGPISVPLKTAGRKLKGLVKGSFRAIRVVRRGVSPRVLLADVIGTGGTTRVTGEQLQARFSLMDSWMTFRVVDGSGKAVKTPSPGATTTAPSSPPATPPGTTAPATSTPGGGAVSP
jgi:stage II sporulation protein D